MKKIALYGWTKYPTWSPVVQEASEGMELDADYVRVSKIIEIEFEALSKEQLVPMKIKALDAKRAEIVDQFAAELKEIDDRKAELLSLTCDSPEPAKVDDDILF